MPITEQRRIESHQEQLARLQGEVESLRQELRRSQRLATIGTMTAMVAHEFNNILTPIINYTQLARTNPTLVPKAIDRASEGSQRATDICRAILGLTKGQTEAPAEVNLRELVDETLSAMAREPQRDAIELTVDVAESLTLLTRRLEMEHVLLNLLINARTAVLKKHAPRHIRIAATQDEHETVIHVIDDGIGIEPDVIDRIWDPYFTTGDQDDDGASAGHGLGLCLCREIVHSMNGMIGVQSQPRRGATFTIRLPR